MREDECQYIATTLQCTAPTTTSEFPVPQTNRHRISSVLPSVTRAHDINGRGIGPDLAVRKQGRRHASHVGRRPLQFQVPAQLARPWPLDMATVPPSRPECTTELAFRKVAPPCSVTQPLTMMQRRCHKHCRDRHK